MRARSSVGKNRQNFMYTLFLDAEVRPGVNSANIVKLLVAAEFHVSYTFWICFLWRFF